MKFKKIAMVIGCSLMMLVVQTSQSTGGGPFVWSYHIPLLSASALSDDGELFLVGCKNGGYFVFDRYGNVVLNRTFEHEIHSVDVAGNGSMIFGLENGIVFLDRFGNIKSREYLTERVLYVSMAGDGSYAVAGTRGEIFLMSPRGLKWKSEIKDEDSENRSHRGEISSVNPVEISKVIISAGGSSIAVAAQEKVFLFNSKSGTCKAQIDVGFRVTSLAILPDESEVAIGTEGGTLSLYTIEGKRKFSIPQPGSPTSEALQGSITSVAANAEQILVGTSEGRLYVFNREGSELQDKEASGSVMACDISDDGKVVLVLDSEGNVSFSNISTGTGWKFLIREPISAELSEDGKYVGITGRNGIYFLNNWENTIENTGYFPYSSRGSFSLKDDLFAVWSYPVGDNCVFDYGDINGDGQNEVVLGSGTELVILNYRGEQIWRESSFLTKIGSVHVHDLTGDAVPEIIVGLDDGKLDMQVWSGSHELLYSFDFMDRFPVNQEPGIGMNFITAMDIDRDEAIEILSEVRSEHLLGRRGIYAFEYPSGKEEWFYETAPLVLGCALADINKDDNVEIILGSESPCTGNAVGSKDDAHVYVMAIDSKGKEIWVKEIGGKFLQLFVAISDLDGDGWKEIVGTVGSSDNTFGKLFILNRKGTYIDEKEFDYSVWLGGIADFEKDGFQEIVVTDSEGRIVMYDRNLVPLRQNEIGQNITPHVRGVADLDGNGILEIVLVTGDGDLKILDSSFAELVSMEFDGKHVTVAKISGCAVDLLVNFSDKIEMYSLKYEKTAFCPFVKKNLEYPEIYFDKAETHYISLRFKEAGECYGTAKRLYEEAGNMDGAIESNRMLERMDNFYDASSKISNGRKKLTDDDFKRARYDFLDEEILIELEEWLQSAKNDFFEAKVLFEGLLEDEEHAEVEEWLRTQIIECENSLKDCDELENAFSSFMNGRKEMERKDYKRAKEYFDSALETFKKYKFEQLMEESNNSLKKIEEYQKGEESTRMIYVIIVVLLSGVPIVGLFYYGLKLLQDIMYRNEKLSTRDSLLYTFHMRKFPEFSVIRNPYYAGRPVRDSSMFFGRESLHNSLKENLASPGRPSIILHGERKTGKTSILFQIENGKLNLGPEFIPVYIDMNKMIIKDDYEFLSILASLIREAILSHQIQMPPILPEKEGMAKNPYLFFRRLSQNSSFNEK